MDELDTRYRKRGLALLLIETEGWTVDTPEGVDSRLIFVDQTIDARQVEKIRAVYPALV